MAIAWIVIGVVLLAVELHHLAFYSLFAAIGCFGAAVVALFAPEAIALQVLTAVILAGAGIVLVRGRVSEAITHRHAGDHARGVHGGLVGQEVRTLDVVGDTTQVGHVRLAGERWRAVSGGDHPIPAGTLVLVTAVEGTTLIVWPVGGHLPSGAEHPDPAEGQGPEAVEGPRLDNQEQEKQ